MFHGILRYLLQYPPPISKEGPEEIEPCLRFCFWDGGGIEGVSFTLYYIIVHYTIMYSIERGYLRSLSALSRPAAGAVVMATPVATTLDQESAAAEASDQPLFGAFYTQTPGLDPPMGSVIHAIYIYTCIHIYIYMCVCVERERERESSIRAQNGGFYLF